MSSLYVLTIFAIGLSNIYVYDTAPTKYCTTYHTQFSLEEFHKTGKKKPQTKKKKKIFAEVLQHAIAAALDSSCSQSHHAIIKSLLSLSTATTYIHTYVVCSDGIKRSREPTNRRGKPATVYQSSLIPLRINEKIDPYVHSGLCVQIHHDVHTYFVVVVWL